MFTQSIRWCQILGDAGMGAEGLQFTHRPAIGIL